MNHHCHHCRGPLIGQSPHQLCPKCRRIAPKAMAQQSQLREADRFWTGTLVFTDDELAVMDGETKWN